ncbi:hypothetical protein [Streptomyces xantholiticus]|uniref:Uncharacterized protein n=1 Tax=Streptomyces xantholiticus TaxID=68285 RepID=A0ABV1UUC0_9ACTN
MIAPTLEQIAGTVGARAITEFGIDVSRLHWDMTSMSVHGAYPVEDQDEQYPVISYGHPKDRRVDLKQVQAGLAVSADGSIPVLARDLGGGAAEVSQVVGAMKDRSPVRRVAATTRPGRRSRPGPRSSPPSAASSPACAGPSPPTGTTPPPWSGTSTETSWTQRPLSTARTHC